MQRAVSQLGRSILPTHSCVHWVGRTGKSDSGVRLSWSGSGFVVRFAGTGLSATFDDPGNVFTIVVDDGQPRPLMLNPGRSRVSLVGELESAVHTLECYRRTEPMVGTTTCVALHVEGDADCDLLPPRLKSRRIEVVGDSISCGYGNEADDPELLFSADTENHYMSYGALVARELDAELSTVAWSGRGVVRNYDDQPGPLVPELYRRTLPEEEAPWPFADERHLVIVNAGTNDFAVEPGPDVATFVQGYVQLLETIREHRPHAGILTTIGPMLSDTTRARAEACIRAAVAVRCERGDTGLVFHSMTTKNESPGANEHPSVATHARMAQELLPVAQLMLGS